MHPDLRGFQSPSKESLARIWQQGTFVVDTNVLLNLYRYPQTARDDLLRVLEKLRPRLFLPFHVALEYERNRLTVIADQRKRFADVRKVVKDVIGSMEGQVGSLQLKRRHSLINPDAFISQIASAVATFQEQLQTLEQLQTSISDRDEVKEKITELFSGLIGNPPKSQDDLERIYKDGQARYALRTPPGYLDQEKSDKGDRFSFGGFTYSLQFADLLIWEQTIAASAERKLQSVGFITDDDKEDWWWIIESQGPKRIGPRPELTEEITRRGGVKDFFVYNSEQLIRASQEYLTIDVENRSAEQIKDAKLLAQVPTRRRRRGSRWRGEHQLVRAVLRWLEDRFPSSKATVSPAFPDVRLLTVDGRSIGVEIVSILSPLVGLHIEEKIARFAARLVVGGSLDEAWIVVEMRDPIIGADILENVSRELRASTAGRQIGVAFGSVSIDAAGVANFVPSVVVEPGNAVAYEPMQNSGDPFPDEQ